MLRDFIQHDINQNLGAYSELRQRLSKSNSSKSSISMQPVDIQYSELVVIKRRRRDDTILETEKG